MNTKTDYYETYWSSAGHQPIGGLSGDVRRLFERHIGAGSSCLDVGCGDGRTAGVWLSQQARQYTGVDVSSRAVEMARSIGLDAVCIEDAAALPFPDSSFDVAVCLEVFEHLFDPQLAAGEIARVLRPGGVLLATVPNVSHWKTRVDLAVRGRWDPRGDRLSVAQPWRDPHVRFFTPSSLGRMLRQRGFDDITVGGRQASIVRNFRHLERFARPETGRLGRWLVQRMPMLGGGLFAVAVTPK
jgi:SAM-dependent methyltransferase